MYVLSGTVVFWIRIPIPKYPPTNQAAKEIHHQAKRLRNNFWSWKAQHHTGALVEKADLQEAPWYIRFATVIAISLSVSLFWSATYDSQVVAY